MACCHLSILSLHILIHRIHIAQSRLDVWKINMFQYIQSIETSSLKKLYEIILFLSYLSDTCHILNPFFIFENIGVNALSDSHHVVWRIVWNNKFLRSNQSWLPKFRWKWVRWSNSSENRLLSWFVETDQWSTKVLLIFPIEGGSFIFIWW